MQLHDLLDDAVADVHADLPALATGSRRQGLSIRRRRRALATVGTAAATTVLAAGLWAAVPGDDGRDPDRGSVATEPSPAPALSGATAPITDRGTVAALRATVGSVADGGTVSRFQGDVSFGEAQAALLLDPEPGSGPAGQVFLDLQRVAMAGAAPYGCAGYLEEFITDCTVRRLPGGDTLRTYREDDDTEFGVGSQYVAAEVISPDRHLRVLVSARNTNPWAEGVLRDRPVLTVAQLTEIATQEWWSRTELPQEYVDAGADVELYEG